MNRPGGRGEENGMNEQNSAVCRIEFDELRRRVEACEERLHHGDTTLALLDQRLSQIDSKMGELAEGIKALQLKPAKRWDAVTGQVVNWLIALLLGVLAVRVGLG